MIVYDNVKVLDFHSLYPSIICQLNLSSEFNYSNNYSDDKDNNLVINKDEFVYNKKGILSNYIKELMNLREDYKSKGLESEQLAVKIIQNSVYGILSQRTAKFVLGGTNIASTITWFGRNVLNNLVKKLKDYDIIVVYGKTDSIFVVDECGRSGGEILSICQGVTNEIVKELSGRDNEYIVFDLEDELEKVLLVNKNNYVKVYNVDDIKVKGASFFNKTYSQFQIDLTNYLINDIIVNNNVFEEHIVELGYDFLNDKLKNNSIDYFSIKHKLREDKINRYDDNSYLLDNDLSIDYGFYYNAVDTNKGIIVYPVNHNLNNNYVVNKKWLIEQVDKIINKFELESKFKQVTLF